MPTSKLDIFPKIVPYIPNNKKTFWAFTSTSPGSVDTTFLNKHPLYENMKYGTIFTLSGDFWGYDISFFNLYPEKEILLEPERKFLIDEVMPMNDIIRVRCILEDTPIVLSEEYITLKYKRSSNLKLFGGKFIYNNRNIISNIIYNNKEYNFGNDLMKFEIPTDEKDELIKIKINISGLIDLSYMFYECEQLLYLPEEWDTSKVIDMNHMFCRCSSLSSFPDISKWNTSNVTNMDSMFDSCNSLTSLSSISNWDTSKVVKMNSMFNSCSSLTSFPDISKWDTSNVINMCSMFSGCSSLSLLPDISKWNTSSLTDISWMFKNCTSLVSLPDISKWDISKVTNLSFMFYNCKNLSNLPDISKWNVSQVTDFEYIFGFCTSLSEIPDIIKKLNISDNTTIKFMFDGCEQLINKFNI